MWASGLSQNYFCIESQRFFAVNGENNIPVIEQTLSPTLWQFVKYPGKDCHDLVIRLFVL
jgi:hypothetical protein